MHLTTETWPPARQRALGDILRRAARAHPDREFAVFPAARFTYGAFDAWVDRLAHGLAGMGVAKGSKVAVMLPNCGEFLAVWFACARLGAIEVPINTSLRGQLLRHILNHSESQVLVAAPEFLEQVKAVAPELTALQAIVVTADQACNFDGLPFSQHLFGELEAQVPEAWVERDIEPTDPLAIIFTSGTTGPSKGALLSHNYFWWFGERSCELRGSGSEDRLYTCLPLFHANAQALTAMPALLRGAAAIFDTHFTASSFWDRLRHFDATHFNYIGGMIPILMKQAPGPRDREHRVSVAMGAAAPVDQWLGFEARFGLRLLECYGQTEDCAVTCNPLGAARIGSIGQAAWGYEMQVFDDEDRPVADGAIGEFVVRPLLPNVMMLGYYKMPQETLNVFQNLWFHTGDLGSQDADGYFYFKDRKKDAIRRRGENISAYEVELAVNEHPAILESAAFGVPSSVGEDDVMVVAILRPGHALSGLDLVRHLEDRLAYFAVPRYVDFPAELPKTPTHRVEKYRLRQQGITPTTWDRETSGYQIRRNKEKTHAV